MAVITAEVITTHHEISLRFRLKLRYLVICAVETAAVITATFLKYIICITPFKNAAKDSLPMPRQYKQIHCVLGKISLFFRGYILQRWQARQGTNPMEEGSKPSDSIKQEAKPLVRWKVEKRDPRKPILKKLKTCQRCYTRLCKL